MRLSKKQLIIGAALLSGSLLFFAIKLAGEQTYIAKDLDVTLRVRTLLNQTDTDNDGLKDWEEILWKTSPTNPDTDNDGTSDGDEVAQNRNPLVKSPDDVLQDKSSQTEVFNENLTPTDKFAQDFFKLYLIKKQEKGVVDEDTQKEIIDQLLLKTPEASFKTYSISDISISAKKDGATLKTYGNTIGKLFKESALPENAYEPLQTMEEALANNDPNGLNEIKILEKDGENIVRELLVLAVPQPLADKHLKLINAISSLAADFKAMANVLNDPLSAIVHIQSYFGSVRKIGDALKEIAHYFLENNITFQQQEDGSLLMNTI
ncbi:MAG: hypothetical protein KAR00_03640 [Candidatus Pacebacteria bacterium]|nr:hypothetical protein [Candidatus Paceibacterota bacterium]